MHTHIASLQCGDGGTLATQTSPHYKQLHSLQPQLSIPTPPCHEQPTQPPHGNDYLHTGTLQTVEGWFATYSVYKYHA